MKMDGRAAIVDIDDDERVVVFDTYKLKKITAVDMFPRTCHVESVCLLIKTK